MMSQCKHNWFSDSPFNAPFFGIDTAAQSLNRHAIFIRPLSHSLNAAIKFNQSIVGFVVGLLFSGCPSAILWAVSFRVVNTIYGKFRPRLLSHVEQKEFKVFPAGAHAVANIKWFQGSLWITTLQHICPSFVSWRTPRTVLSNASSSIVSKTTFAAPTTSNVLVSKQLRECDFIIPAIAFAHPAYAFIALWRQTIKRYQTAKSLVRNVCCFHGDNNSVDTIISQGCF